jgi:hypothetical protein
VVIAGFIALVLLAFFFLEMNGINQEEAEAKARSVFEAREGLQPMLVQSEQQADGSWSVKAQAVAKMNAVHSATPTGGFAIKRIITVDRQGGIVDYRAVP